MVQLEEMRLSLIQCTKSSEAEKAIIKYVELLRKVDAKVGLNKAFDAVSIAYQAKITNNLFKKIDYLQIFHAKITEAVLEQHGSYEIIFLRYLIQSSISPGLGFSESILKDKQFLTNNLEMMNSSDFILEYKKYINDFINKRNN
jgi:hypothetical protein